LVIEKAQLVEYDAKWNAASFPSGLYMIRLQVGEFIDTRKMLLIKY
jgi:hypothetical protein